MPLHQGLTPAPTIPSNVMREETANWAPTRQTVVSRHMHRHRPLQHQTNARTDGGEGWADTEDTLKNEKQAR